MIVVGYQMQGATLTNSRGAAIPCTSVEDIVDELMEPYRMQGDGTATWKVAWFLDDIMVALLRLLPRDLVQTLGEKESVEFSLATREGRHKRYRLWYPRQDGVAQCICMTDRSDPNTPWGQWPEVYVWNISLHCPDGMEPPKDALEAEMYGRKVLDICAKVLKIQAVPKHFFSPVNILKPYVQSWGLPQVKDLPPKVANYAAKCMSPPWVESHQIGYWDRAYDVDLSNAYGTILRDLPDWRLGEWFESTDFQEKAAFGYCLCDLFIRPEVSLHPILMEVEDSESGLTLSATGWQRERFLTSRQIKFIQQWKLGEVRLHDGVWWFPKKVRQPLKTVIERLTSQREAMEGELKPVDAKLGRFVAKKMIVGLWGYCARWDWERGKAPDEFYNPVWAAEITTRIPLRVASLIYRKKVMQNVICMAVDGFNADCEVDLTPEDENLGWKFAECGPTLCLSSHHSWMGDRRPEGLLLRDIIDLLKSKPKATMWAVTHSRKATLGDCMVRGNLSLLGQKIDVPMTVHLQQEHNRIFRPAPKTGRDLLSKKFRSKPYNLDDLARAESVEAVA
jgi:hypothetical protein